MCTAHLGHDQESTYLACLSTLAHHGVIYIPLGYAPGDGFKILGNVEELRGGSPWESGSLSSSDGSRMPTDTKLKPVTFKDVISTKLLRRRFRKRCIKVYSNRITCILCL